MRVTGGTLRGRPLARPKGDGGTARLRPSSDRMRESLFNLLAHGDWPPLEGARVLDLFAGTGALGLEAISRGAERVQFVDDGPEARALLRTNIEALDLIGRAKVYRRDATRLGANRGAPYGWVFLDPPYGRGLGPRALASALAGDWLAPGAAIVLETGADETPELPPEIAARETRIYGAAKLTLAYRKSP